VSVTTHRRDLGPKLTVCASAGVPQYWAVDPRRDHGYLLRHTEPVGDTYAHVRRIPVGYCAEHLDAATILAEA
jgi:Uma2 family endonuclease